MLFLCLRWQWILLSRLGVALLSFVLVSWMRCLFLGSPLRPPRLVTRQLCGSGCVCRPEFSVIRSKNNSIYLNRMNPLFTLGEEFRFHDSSRFHKKAGDAKLPFYYGFVPVLMSLAAESCRSRAESVHLLSKTATSVTRSSPAPGNGESTSSSRRTSNQEKAISSLPNEHEVSYHLDWDR